MQTASAQFATKKRSQTRLLEGTLFQIKNGYCGDGVFLPVPIMPLQLSLIHIFEYNGVTAEVTQPADSYCVHQLRSEIHETDEIPVRLVGLMTSTINQATYEVTEGYSDYTIAGYPAHIKQTKFVGYLSTEVRFQVGDNNYRAFAYTYVDDSNMDVKATAEAVKVLNENETVYFQKSLDFLDAMVKAAEFTEPDEEWFK